METATFICGCGHSGTTLLAAMFAANPVVYVPLKETEAFLVPEKSLERWHALVAEAKLSAKPHFVEKTPRHLRHMSEIRGHVPLAKFILLVRDGRDVAASFLRRYGSIDRGVRRWIEDNNIVAMEQNAADTLMVRYEDLVTCPEAELQRCCVFAGVPYHAAMLSYHETTRFWFGEKDIREGTGKDGKEHRALRNWQVNQPLYDGSGKWRHLLTQEHIAALPIDEMKPLLARFGYD
jgi:hypothetical protein